MIDTTGVAFVFHAQLAFWIRRLRSGFSSSDRFRIFFRFGEVDRKFDFSIRRIGTPALVAGNTVAANIVGILRKFVEVVRCSFRAFFIQFFERCLNLGRARQKSVHQFGIEQIPISNRVFDDGTLCSSVQQIIQDFRQRNFGSVGV